LGGVRDSLVHLAERELDEIERGEIDHPRTNHAGHRRNRLARVHELTPDRDVVAHQP